MRPVARSRSSLSRGQGPRAPHLIGLLVCAAFAAACDHYFYEPLVCVDRCAPGSPCVTVCFQPDAGVEMGSMGDLTVAGEPDFAGPPTCIDGLANGEESDVDCGGPLCPRCGDGKACKLATDCASAACTGGLCAAPSCTDVARNGSESDVDCGGPDCPKCGQGKTCAQASDCTSSICSKGLCTTAGCVDNVANGDETDVDCGGPCPPCADGKACRLAADCASAVCASGQCAAPTCSDQAKNGRETDVDCGGSCAACGDGRGCAQGGDCASRVCANALCVAASCTDGLKNGSETDTDCGATCPSRCAEGKACAAASDCANGVCTASVCQGAACADGVRNGSETDVDCGGSCAACGDGQACAVAGDCKSGVCAASACAAATCTDNVRNGTETDVDCGGACATRCAEGKACGGASDCASGVCNGGRCAAPACSDAVKNGTETDVDCGGPCSPCSSGKGCAAAGDCASKLCRSGRCLYYTRDGLRLELTTAPMKGSGAQSGQVALWSDTSGNGFDMKPPPDTARWPLFIDAATPAGTAAVRFSATSTTLLTTASVKLFDTPKLMATMFVVVRAGATQRDPWATIFDYNHASCRNFVLQQDYEKQNYFYPATVALDPGRFQLLTLQIEDVGSEVRQAVTVNGSAQTWIGNCPGLVWIEPAAATLGGNVNWTRYLNGDIAAVLAYNRVLPAVELADMERSLMALYGL